MMQMFRQSVRRFPGTLVAGACGVTLAAAIALSGCSSGSAGTTTISGPPVIPRPTGPGGSPTDSTGSTGTTTPGGGTSTPLAALSDGANSEVATSADAILALATAARVMTGLVLTGSDLITSPATVSGTAVGLDPCPAPANTPINQITFNVFEPGHPLPAGKDLNASLALCPLAGAEVSGFLDLAGISVTGVPDPQIGGWHVEGTLAFNSLELSYGAARLILSNTARYAADLNDGVLRTTFDADSLNAEHELSADTRINYQFEPFFLETVQDAATQTFSLNVSSSPGRGASVLTRYTTKAQPNAQGGVNWVSQGDDVIRELVTEVPLAWRTQEPVFATDIPAAGTWILTRPEDQASIRAALGQTGRPNEVVITIDEGGSTVSRIVDWNTLSIFTAGT